MKTETLIELQRSITQGEWKADIHMGNNGYEIADMIEPSVCEMVSIHSPEETKHNARAIALVPELIAEVIRLRALLAETELGLAVVVDSKHSTTAIANVYDKVCIARAALANDK